MYVHMAPCIQCMHVFVHMPVWISVYHSVTGCYVLSAVVMVPSWLCPLEPSSQSHLTSSPQENTTRALNAAHKPFQPNQPAIKLAPHMPQTWRTVHSSDCGGAAGKESLNIHDLIHHYSNIYLAPYLILATLLAVSVTRESTQSTMSVASFDTNLQAI